MVASVKKTTATQQIQATLSVKTCFGLTENEFFSEKLPRLLESVTTFFVCFLRGQDVFVARFFLGENKKGPFVVADKPHLEIK